MTLYRLTAPKKMGDMPEGYTFQISSATSPTPNAKDIETEIIKLGFNRQTQSYKSPGNWKIEKIG